MERRVRRDGRRETNRGRRILLGGTTVADDHGSTGEVLGVLGNGGDARVRDGEPPTAVAIRVRHRTALAQVLPNGVRIGHPLGIGVIPVGSEVFYWGLDGHAYSSMKMACSGQFN